MGQEEIVKILKLEPDRWFTQKELVDLTKTSQTNISYCLKKLNKIEIKEGTMNKFNEFWGKTLVCKVKLYKYKCKIIKK